MHSNKKRKLNECDDGKYCRMTLQSDITTLLNQWLVGKSTYRKNRTKTSGFHSENELFCYLYKVQYLRVKEVFEKHFGSVISKLSSKFNKTTMTMALAEAYFDTPQFLKREKEEKLLQTDVQIDDFFVLCKITIPRRILLDILSYLVCDMSLILSCGAVNSSWYILILSHWRQTLHVEETNMYSISRYVLKNGDSVHIQVCSKKNMKYVVGTVDPVELCVIYGGQNFLSHYHPNHRFLRLKKLIMCGIEEEKFSGRLGYLDGWFSISNHFSTNRSLSCCFPNLEYVKNVRIGEVMKDKKSLDLVNLRRLNSIKFLMSSRGIYVKEKGEFLTLTSRSLYRYFPGQDPSTRSYDVPSYTFNEIILGLDERIFHYTAILKIAELWIYFGKQTNLLKECAEDRKLDRKFYSEHTKLLCRGDIEKYSKLPQRVRRVRESMKCLDDFLSKFENLRVLRLEFCRSHENWIISKDITLLSSAEDRVKRFDSSAFKINLSKILSSKLEKFTLNLQYYDFLFDGTVPLLIGGNSKMRYLPPFRICCSQYGEFSNLREMTIHGFLPRMMLEMLKSQEFPKLRKLRVKIRNKLRKLHRLKKKDNELQNGRRFHRVAKKDISKKDDDKEDEEKLVVDEVNLLEKIMKIVVFGEKGESKIEDFQILIEVPKFKFCFDFRYSKQLKRIFYTLVAKGSILNELDEKGRLTRGEELEHFLPREPDQSKSRVRRGGPEFARKMNQNVRVGYESNRIDWVLYGILLNSLHSNTKERVESLLLRFSLRCDYEEYFEVDLKKIGWKCLERRCDWFPVKKRVSGYLDNSRLSTLKVFVGKYVPSSKKKSERDFVIE